MSNDLILLLAIPIALVHVIITSQRQQPEPMRLHEGAGAFLLLVAVFALGYSLLICIAAEVYDALAGLPAWAKSIE